MQASTTTGRLQGSRNNTMSVFAAKFLNDSVLLKLNRFDEQAEKCEPPLDKAS